MLNSIVDNLEQCGQQNIVQCCFHQARTGCAFLAVYWVTMLGLAGLSWCFVKMVFVSRSLLWVCIRILMRLNHDYTSDCISNEIDSRNIRYSNQPDSAAHLQEHWAIDSILTIAS